MIRASKRQIALADQAAEWETLRGGPAIGTLLVAGDFNLAVPYPRYFGSRQSVEALDDALQRHDLVCLTPGNASIEDSPRIDHICIQRSGLKSSRLPLPGDWAVPLVQEKPITDHVGVFVDLDLSSSP